MRERSCERCICWMTAICGDIQDAICMEIARRRSVSAEEQMPTLHVRSGRCGAAATSAPTGAGRGRVAHHRPATRGLGPPDVRDSLLPSVACDRTVACNRPVACDRMGEGSFSLKSPLPPGEG